MSSDCHPGVVSDDPDVDGRPLRQWYGSARALPWREGLRTVLLGALVLAFVFGGVMIVDPAPRTDGAEPVDTDARPARIAYQAMLQPATGNYVVDTYAGPPGEGPHLLRLRVDAADGQYLRVDEPGGDYSWRTYVDDGGRWRADVRTDDWYHYETAPWRPGSVAQPERVLDDGADVELVSRNDSVVVVRVADDETAERVMRGTAGLAHTASLTLAVDRETGMLRRMTFRLNDTTVEGEGRATVSVFRDWGAVDVTRPSGDRYGFEAVLADVRRGCLV